MSMLIEKFEAESYLKLLIKINEYAKLKNLEIIEFSTDDNEALVLFEKK